MKLLVAEMLFYKSTCILIQFFVKEYSRMSAHELGLKTLLLLKFNTKFTYWLKKVLIVYALYYLHLIYIIYSANFSHLE